MKTRSAKDFMNIYKSIGSRVKLIRVWKIIKLNILFLNPIYLKGAFFSNKLSLTFSEERIEPST
jgi:hypothetical protein